MKTQERLQLFVSTLLLIALLFCVMIPALYFDTYWSSTP